MDSPSILNDVLGPVMRGPSSSHTAGSHHIGLVLRALLGEEPASARFTFDRRGSYAQTYRQQGVDLALTSGLMGWELTDEGFRDSLVKARKEGLRLSFLVDDLKHADHPNSVDVVLKSKSGGILRASARSTGGGGFQVTRVDGQPVYLDGRAHELLIRGNRGLRGILTPLLKKSFKALGKPLLTHRGGRTFALVRLSRDPESAVIHHLESQSEVHWLRISPPVFRIPKGPPLFESAADMVRTAAGKRWTLGRTALAYESKLLGIPEKEVAEIILRRYQIMKDSVDRGLSGTGVRMQLLRPSAGKIWRAEQRGQLAVGGLHTRAAARALAAMHVSNSLGVVCAAPTGGSAGVIPGIIVTLAEEWKLPHERIVRSLLAASAIGLIVAKRATFAAEIAGCQVEIGAAGAMGAAGIVEAAGGKARQAADAAAIFFQNTMGSVCDLVQGMCEIPCHTRNAAAASSAFLCADMILGGYENPIPLDETIDAVLDSGKMLPSELRVTALGGLAMAPSARRLPNLRKRRKV
jgi:L-serine dehydratase